MKIRSNSFLDGHVISDEFAFARIASTGHVTLANNKNPHLSWSDVPSGTKSFALTCIDHDVPSRPDDVNKEGRIIPISLPRTDFYHWTLFDIPLDQYEISAGTHSRGVTLRGKPGPEAPRGLRHGLNDYTSWFAGDVEMKGSYYGYDGPCPPWNDMLVHRYIFTVYALDIQRIVVTGPLSGITVHEELNRHSLAQASISALYTLNPAVLDNLRVSR